MRRTIVLLSTILAGLVLSSCTNKSAVEPSAKRHATVSTQDGTTMSGTVVASSPSEITLAGDDSITRTIPMEQVKSIEYAEEAATPAGRPDPSPLAGRRDQPRQAAPETRSYDLPAGTQISVRNDEPINSTTAAEGQSFGAQVQADVLDASGVVAIPRGSRAQLMIISASGGGRIKGAADLVVTLGSVSVEGRRYALDTSNLQQRGQSGVGANKRTATYTGGGAAVGAIIGAIAGGGKGAAIGAGAGAGAGALTQILTRGKAIRIPAESMLSFRLDTPVRIVATP